MSPLTTPYSGRVAGGDMATVRRATAFLGSTSFHDVGLNAFRRAPMTPSLMTSSSNTFSMAFGPALVLENVAGASLATLAVTRFETGRA
jgi:hypothetical protein